MKHLFAPVLVIATVIAFSTCQAVSGSTLDGAIGRLQFEQTLRVALLVRFHSIEQSLNERLNSYHPLSLEAIGKMNDVTQLRAKLIEAQGAAQETRDVVAANLSATDVANKLSSSAVTSALATAISNPQPLTQPFIYSVGGTRVLAVYDTTTTGSAPAVSPALSTACNVMTYITGAFGTAGPQFISTSGQTTGQKNTLSIIGFGLGIVPIAMNCTKDHSTTPNAGQPQQPPQQ
jgi:hypothetical protein